MLVLSRKTGERIRIGDSTEITIIRMTNGQVRIGIDSPKDVAIVRSELLDEATTTELATTPA